MGRSAHQATVVWVTILLMLQTTPVIGDVAARDFGTFCRDPLPADRMSRFRQNLTATETALASRDAEEARESFDIAMSAVYRGGGESDVSVKCLGESTAGRWFDAKLELKRQQTAQRNSTDLYLIAADQGADGLVSTITQKEGSQIGSSVNWLQEIARRLRAEQAYGAFLLPGEQRILAASDTALKEIRALADKAIQAALREEAAAFERPVSDQERDLVTNTNNLASGLLGVELQLTDDPEVLYLERRAQESMEKLQKARAWDLKSAEDPGEPAWGTRARKRGDTVLEKAGDSQLSFAGRDNLYALAAEYYDFGGWAEQRDRAESMRERIRPEVEAEQAQKSAQLEQAEAEMERKAQSARESAEKMMKTEQEKQQFNKEADAMEAELGF